MICINSAQNVWYLMQSTKEHWPLGVWVLRLELSYKKFCRSHNDEEDKEFAEHLFPGLWQLRQTIFGQQRDCNISGCINL